jgi:hypothetical protein
VKLGLIIEELHRSETDLAEELLHLSDRHRADHEIFHVGRDLAAWSQEHVAELAGAGQEFGLDLDGPPGDATGPLGALRRKSAEVLGRRHDAGLTLLADLRRLYRKASGVSLDWEILAQSAQAAKNRELLALAQRCHPQTLRQTRWLNAMLKESSAQVLVS